MSNPGRVHTYYLSFLYREVSSDSVSLSHLLCFLVLEEDQAVIDASVLYFTLA